jgi:hypothetical protein
MPFPRPLSSCRRRKRRLSLESAADRNHSFSRRHSAGSASYAAVEVSVSLARLGVRVAHDGDASAPF